MAPRILATCSRCVFKSFKKFERWSERFVSRIGPFFVGLAVILIGGCAFTYFDVVFRERFLAPDTSYAALILGSAWSAWLYYKAITVPPGTPLDPPRATPDRRAWPALVPSALCVGPLRGLATQGKDDRRKSKVIWLVALGETAVESHDNDWYRKTAKARGRTFRNPYHLGWRQNLAEFFNVGPNGYHWSTILLPIEVPPASDGWTYQKIQGWQEFAMEFDDELTDEEEMSDEE
ncbi:hypothetical protein RQP46_004590 [Phenoliferia psychrophenolica]